MDWIGSSDIVRSVCTICGDEERHPLALHTRCRIGKCEGRYYIPEVEDNVEFKEFDPEQYWIDKMADINEEIKRGDYERTEK
tara:strand:- start:253 stop:498 length:246 start_codon:yes stop_codon:yes gene_type:complete